MTDAESFVLEIKKMIAEEVAKNNALMLQHIFSLEKKVTKLIDEPHSTIIKVEAPVVNPTPLQVNVENKVEAPIVNPTPVDVKVHNHNKIEPTIVNVEAPIVNPTPVDVHVAAPKVNINPNLQIEKSEPPTVQVNIPDQIFVKMPARESQTYVTRDEKGKVTGSKTLEKDGE